MRSLTKSSDASRAAAKIHIRAAASMTPEGRKYVADWLRESADSLERLGAEYSPSFNAYYIPRS